MANILSELKRRKVLRVAAAYVISSWVLLQVADLLASILELPDWTSKFVLLILIVGFVPALILSWAYTADTDGRESVHSGAGSKIPGVVAGLIILAALIGGGFWYSGADARWARNVAMP